MSFLKKVSALKEKALYRVALNLCQDNSFKELAMCLEKPMHSFVIFDRMNVFMNSPEMLIWTKVSEAEMKEGHHLENTLNYSLFSNSPDKAGLWDVAVKEECQRLSDGFPNSFKPELQVWISRIALEYLSYSRRQESLFGVSRYFLMNILTQEDWTEAGRLNEIKIAKRLLRDMRLSNLQKYRIACVYCFQGSISEWWSKLSQEEKQSLSHSDEPDHEENGSLVSVWSNYGDLDQNVELQELFPWQSAAYIAVRFGIKAALMLCWEKIPQSDRHWMVTSMALKALKEWKVAEILESIRRKKLFSNEHCSPCDAPVLNLPHYYSELVHFFLSQMCENEIVGLFEKAFKKEGRERGCITTKMCALECLLNWPLQDYFLPTMNLLWGTIPMSKYGQCLFLLACKYSGALKKYYSSTSLNLKIHSYDYECMFWNLWKGTPDEYKQYVFYNNKKGSDNYSSTVIKKVLLQLLEKNPFGNRDVALFKRVWLDLPQEIRRAMLAIREPQMRFTYNDAISWILLEKEKWSLANWLLDRNFSNEEIINYKKQLIESRKSDCFSKLRENCFKFVEDLINWCLLTDTEKMKFKYKLFSDHYCWFCSTLLNEREFTKVEKIMDFCLISDDKKEEHKVYSGEVACRFLESDCEWELMDKIITLCNKSEAEIRNFKKFLFSSIGLYTHFRLVFVEENWENAKSFYKWFCLSSEEITNIKKRTVFMPQVIERVHKALYENGIDEIKPCLRWCLTNEEIVIDFKEEVKKRYFNNVLRKENDKARKCLDNLVSELLSDLRGDGVCDVTNREDTSMNEKGEKRFLVIEDGSSSAKRLKHKT